MASLALSSVAQAKHNRDNEEDADDAQSAAAEPKEFRFDFGLTAGMHFFDSQSGLGRFTDTPADLSPKTQVALGGRLALNFNRYLRSRARRCGSPPTRSARMPTAARKINVFAYRGSLLVHLAPPGVVRPFLLVGYGALSSISNNSSVSFGDTDGLLHGGVGLKIAFGDYVGLRLEGRILAPPAFLSHSVAVGNETGFHGPDYEALGSLYFNFGEVEKIRGRSRRSASSSRSRPRADLDPDRDGIAGKADKCPNLAEDKDGFEDADGCPDPDNDKDGIPDVKDKCPDDPEDKDGFEDADGCPDPDNDKDGIPDVKDKCPNEPETRNGYQDEDGCPDELPPASRSSRASSRASTSRAARRRSCRARTRARLSRRGAEGLPGVRLEISGHTDSRARPTTIATFAARAPTP